MQRRVDAAMDWLGRMEAREGLRRAIFLLVLALIGCVMLLLNAHTPLMMDDYDYSFSWSTGERVSGLVDVIASQAVHYRLWGGRSVVHTLAQLFLLLGKPVFNVANAAMYILLLLEVLALAGYGPGKADSLRRSAGVSCSLVSTSRTAFSSTVFMSTGFIYQNGRSAEATSTKSDRSAAVEA